jgi:antitoxin component of MazEF toxin-antitoxin module
MPLIRKTRTSGSSIVLAIPSQLVEAYDIDRGDELEIIPLGHGEFKVRKARETNGGSG